MVPEDSVIRASHLRAAPLRSPGQVMCNRPILRWHGGKFILAPWIISHLPKHRIYVEPFGGAGSVLLRKTRSLPRFYNDRNGEVVNLFRVARERGDELRRVLELTPYFPR